MSGAIDFTELKQHVTIERATELLGVNLKKAGAQLRGPCPICKDGGDRAFVVTPTKGLFYCFGKCRKGQENQAAPRTHERLLLRRLDNVRKRQTSVISP